MNDDFNNLSSAVEEKLFSMYDDVVSANEGGCFFLEGIEEKELFAEKQLHAQGGCKNIFKVKEVHAGRYVAMAELRDDADEEMSTYFFNEARMTATLEHPNIVPVYHVGVNEKKLPYFTMKFLKDQSLAKIIKEIREDNKAYVNKYSQTALLDIFVKICDAIAYAHSKGVVHLDLKPENIMIGDYGEVYVCDWGLAKRVGAQSYDVPLFDGLGSDSFRPATFTGTVKGTPGFMAPEQINQVAGEKDEKSDIYALGALLYTILTYQIPFEGKPFEEITALTVQGELKAPIQLDSKIPESLNAVVVKAMALKKSDRYDEVEKLIDDIKSYQAGFATSAEEASFIKSFYLLLKRHKGVSLLLGVLIGLSAVSFVSLKNREQKLDIAVNQFKEEQSLRREQLLRSAPSFLEHWQRHPELMDYDWMHEQLSELIVADDNNLFAKKIKTYLYLSYLDFDNAMKTAKTAGKNIENLEETVSRIKELCLNDRRESGYIRGSIARKCLEVNYFQNYEDSYAKLFIAKIFAQLPSDEEKGLFLLGTLKVWGYRGHFDAEGIVVTKDAKITLDLSNKPIKNLNGIEAFPIHILKLRNTEVTEYPEYGIKSVQNADFTGSDKIRTLRGLRYQPNLEFVTLPARKKNSSIERYLKSKNIDYEVAEE